MSQLHTFGELSPTPDPTETAMSYPHQLAMDSLLTQGLRSRLRFYIGYAFGAPTIDGWTHATVTTPRWTRRTLRESSMPIVLDNGAYAAFRDGADFSASEQIDALRDALSLVGDRLLWAVLPDVVGDAAESRRRAELAMDSLNVEPSQWLAPFQEGADAAEFSEWLGRNGLGGAFIGGATKAFKREALAQLVGNVPWVHVARISADHELHWAAHLGADSFDSCTPTYGFKKGRIPCPDRDWASSFNRYCEAVA